MIYIYEEIKKNYVGIYFSLEAVEIITLAYTLVGQVLFDEAESILWKIHIFYLEDRNAPKTWWR